MYYYRQTSGHANAQSSLPSMPRLPCKLSYYVFRSRISAPLLAHHMTPLFRSLQAKRLVDYFTVLHQKHPSPSPHTYMERSSCEAVKSCDGIAHPEYMWFAGLQRCNELLDMPQRWYHIVCSNYYYVHLLLRVPAHPVLVSC